MNGPPRSLFWGSLVVVAIVTLACVVSATLKYIVPFEPLKIYAYHAYEYEHCAGDGNVRLEVDSSFDGPSQTVSLSSSWENVDTGETYPAYNGERGVETHNREWTDAGVVRLAPNDPGRYTVTSTYSDIYGMVGWVHREQEVTAHSGELIEVVECT